MLSTVRLVICSIFVHIHKVLKTTKADIIVQNEFRVFRANRFTNFDEAVAQVGPLGQLSRIYSDCGASNYQRDLLCRRKVRCK